MRYKKHSCLTFIFCFSLFLILACQAKEKEITIQRKYQQLKETPKEEISENYSDIDTTQYYIGELNNKMYVLYFLKTDSGRLTGYYYPIEEESFIHPHYFELITKRKKTTVRTEDTTFTIKLELNKNEFGLMGRYATKEKRFLVTRYKWSKEFIFVLHTPEEPLIPAERYRKKLFDVTIKKDIIYGKAKGYWCSFNAEGESYATVLKKGFSETFQQKTLDLKMDIYLPKNDSINKRPLIIFLHGGAFYIGHKETEPLVKWCNHFSSLGYVTASLDYRLGFYLSKKSIERAAYKAIQDAHAATRYLVSHAKEYGIDTSLIFVAGTSAGAITALSLAFMNNESRPESSKKSGLSPDLGNIESSGNKIKVPFKIKAIANMWGAVNDLEILKNAQVPIVSFHGDNDRVVPIGEGFPFSDIKGNLGERFFNKTYGSGMIDATVKKQGLRSELYVFEGKDHGPHVDDNYHTNEIFTFIQKSIESFFYKEMSLYQRNIISTKDFSSQWFTLSSAENRVVVWHALGGIILQQSKDKARVIWFADAPQKELTVEGLLNSNAYFSNTITIP